MLKYVALGTVGLSDSSWSARFRALDVFDGLRGVPWTALVWELSPVGKPDADAADVLLMLWVADAEVHPSLLSRAFGVKERWQDLIRVDEHLATPAVPYREQAILRLGLVRRRPELTREEFGAHWTGRHMPLVMSNGPLFDRYIVNLPATAHGWDGLLEQQFSGPARMQEHDRLVAEEKPDVAADVTRFIGGAQQFVGRLVARREPTD